MILRQLVSISGRGARGGGGGGSTHKFCRTAPGAPRSVDQLRLLQFTACPCLQDKPHRGMQTKAEPRCCKDTPLLAQEALEKEMGKIPAWSLNEDRTAISKKFTARNFMAALQFFGRVGEAAEKAQHHPDLHLTNYRDVMIVLTTHAIGGLSEFDIRLAAEIDSLPVEYSKRWLEQQRAN